MIRIPDTVETYNRYSLLDNVQGTSRNFNNGDAMNGELTKQVIPNANHSLVTKIYHTHSKKVAEHVTSPNQQHSEHENLHATQRNPQDFSDAHVKLLFDKEESIYIPTIVNGVIIMGARDGTLSSRNGKLIPGNSDSLMYKNIFQKYKCELLIIGDSYARGYAGRVKNLTNDKFEICGFVKPGSGVLIFWQNQQKLRL